MTVKMYDLVGADISRPFSPHCWKIAWAAAHKGLPLERVPVAFGEIRSLEGGAVHTLPTVRIGDSLITDSFAIALYLDEAWPERPSLFAGEGGRAMARFIERWTNLVLHAYIGPAVIMDVHTLLRAEDRQYFRQSREKRFGRKLEELPLGRDDRLASFRAGLEPLRSVLALQPWLGGDVPLFCDYIVAGAFQWARIVSRVALLEESDPVAEWFDRCLALYDGMARRVSAA